MLEAHKEDVTGREKGLSDEEIVTHGVIFLLAGYETTSNALAYCAYLLALHPNIQEKLIEKITDYLKENPVCYIDIGNFYICCYWCWLDIACMFVLVLA